MNLMMIISSVVNIINGFSNWMGTDVQKNKPISLITLCNLWQKVCPPYMHHSQLKLPLNMKHPDIPIAGSAETKDWEGPALTEPHCLTLPSGHLTQLWKMTMYSEFSQYCKNGDFP